MTLVAPEVRFRRSFLEAAREMAESRPMRHLDVPLDLVALASPPAFAAYVSAVVDAASDDARLAEGYVPSSTLWCVDGDDFVGRLSIRHRLNDALLEVGGHIGYEVRPSRRREGHATRMLRDALPLARALGIASALVTCDADNVASRRVIEKNGGVLEDRRGHKLRFWIATSS